MNAKFVFSHLLVACAVLLVRELSLNGNLFFGAPCPSEDRLIHLPKASELLTNLHAVGHLAPAKAIDYEKSTKVLILRHFHDSPFERESLAFFMKYGINKTNFVAKNVSVVIICSGGVFPHDDIKLDNNVIVIERENVGLDFGGYMDALSKLDWANSYDLVVFINGTLLGPLFPLYRLGEDWLSHFTSLLSSYTRLAGMTINLHIQEHREIEPHVQSMLYVMERKTVEDLRNWGVFVPVPASLSKDEVIAKYEVGTSKALLQHGFNIASLLPVFQGIDFTKLQSSECMRQALIKLTPNSKGDVWYQHGYFGGALGPTDTIFVKNNRFQWGANDILAAQRQIFSESSQYTE